MPETAGGGGAHAATQDEGQEEGHHEDCGKVPWGGAAHIDGPHGSTTGAQVGGTWNRGRMSGRPI